MSNLKTQLMILLLVFVQIAVSVEPQQPVEALLRRLDSKRSSASVQQAAAKALLFRLLPTHVDSFEFKIVGKVPINFFVTFLRTNSGFDLNARFCVVFMLESFIIAFCVLLFRILNVRMFVVDIVAL